MTIYTHAVENPNGFNLRRGMYSLSEWRWPLLSENRLISDNDLNPIFEKAAEEAYNKVSKETKFLPDEIGNNIFQFSWSRKFIFIKSK